MSIGGNQNLGTATFYIVGDASGAQTAAAKSNAALASLAGGIQQNLFGLNQLGLAFSALPAAATAGFGLAIKSAIDFESAMFDVSRAAGEIGNEDFMRGTRDAILDIARTVPLATTELAELAAIGAQLGVANENITDFAETMAALLTSTNLTKASVGDFARIANVLGVPAEGFEQMGSVILELGRNTAATETEILNITRRMSGAAGAAGATADQVLGLGAAVISLGPRAEAGGTALNKTFTDISLAIASGGEEIEKFAAVANRSVPDFVDLYQRDAVGAVAALVTELGKMDSIGQVSALEAIGIGEQRQIQALQQLALGTRDVGNSQRDLNQILSDAADYQLNSTALMEAQEARARTLAGQVQILRNIIFEFGAGLGQLGAGPLRFFIDFIGDMLIGFLNMPPALRLVSAALALTVVGLSAVGAVLFLVVPRLLLAAQAYRDLTGAAGSSAGGLSASTAALHANATAANRAAVAAATAAVSQRSLASINSSLAATFPGIGAGISSVGVSAVGAGTQVSRFSGILTKLPTLLRGLGIAGTIAGIGLSLLGVAAARSGNAVRNEAAAAEAAIAPNIELAQIMREQGAAVGQQSLAFIQSLPEYDAVRRAARLLGIDLQILNAIIMGTATVAQFGQFTASLKGASSQARRAAESVLTLGKMFQATSQRAGVAGSAVGGFSEAQEDLAGNTKKANDALRKQHEILSGIAQAYIDLTDALESQHDAQNAVADAQRNYADALEAVNRIQEEIRDAELDLLDARQDHTDALEDLADAERDLQTARAEELEALSDAEDDLADAQDRVIDSGEKIVDLQRELNKLRADDNTDEIRDATNKLADARLRLVASTRKVEDVEFHLQQLREDKASLRDIQDAELALAEAHQEVAEAQDSIIDSTNDLASLTDPVARAEAIRRKERELERAYRDQRDAVDQVQEATRNLDEARLNVVNDTAYQDALRQVRDVNRQVRDAVRGISDAERELGDVRQGLDVRRELFDATEALRDALIGQAKANVEVEKQQVLAAGGMWQADDAARSLAANLGMLFAQFPSEEARGAIRHFIDLLNEVPDVPAPPDTGDDGGGGGWNPNSFGLPTTDQADGYLEDLEAIFSDPPTPEKKDPTIWEDIFGRIDNWWDDQLRFVPKPARDIVGTFVDAGQDAWGKVRGIEAIFGKEGDWIKFGEVQVTALTKGAIEAYKSEGPNVTKKQQELVDAIIQKSLDTLEIRGGKSAVFQKIGKDTYKGLGDGMDYEFSSSVSKIPGKVAGELKRKQETGATTLLKQAGLWMMGGLKDGADQEYESRVSPFFGDLPGRVRDRVGDTSGVLTTPGVALVGGLAWGASDEEARQSGWFANLPWRIRDDVDSGDPRGAMEGTGSALMQGIADGIYRYAELAFNAAREVARKVIDITDGIFGNASPSKVFTKTGQYLMQGLANGIRQDSNKPFNATQKIMNDIVDQNSELGRQFVDSVIAGMESQFSNLDRAIDQVRDLVEEDLIARIEAQLDTQNIQNALNKYLGADYVDGLIRSMQANLGADFATNTAALSLPAVARDASEDSGGGGTTTEVLQLQAITTADPAAIMNEYIWTKRVRLRGGVS